MAETFTLPEELFNSMINGFKDENKTDELNIEVDQNKKNKTDGSSRTILNVTQKRRIANIANVLFDDNARKFFETDFENHLKKIEDIELEQTKEAVNVIKEEAEKEVKEKKNKKKTSFKKRMRQFRMVSHLLKFITDIYNNFKKFGKESSSIIQRHFYDKGFTIRGVLTDKNERDRFVLELKGALNDTVQSFYENLILNSFFPLLELIVKIGLENLLTLLDDIRDKADIIMSGIGKFAGKRLLKTFAKKVATKLAAKAGIKLGIQMIGHTIAAASAGTVVGAPVAAVIEAALWAWTIYDMITAYAEMREMYKDAVKAFNAIGKKFIDIGNTIKELAENSEFLQYISKSGKIDVSYKNPAQFLSYLKNNNISPADLPILRFNQLYEKYTKIDNIILDFRGSVKIR